MLKGKAGNIEEKFLKKFVRRREIPHLRNEQEKRTFRELQRYDLIRVGSAGKLKITSLGQHALSVGVKRYIRNVRLERKLFMEYAKGKIVNRWLVVAGILVLLLFLSGTLWYQL